MLDPYRTPAEISTAPGPPPAFASGEAAPATIAWWVIQSQLGLFLVCYLLVWVPLELITCYLDQHVIDPDDIGTSFRVQQSVGFWFGIIADGAIIATAIAAFSKQGPTLSGSYAKSFRRYGKLWTTRFCVGLLAVLGLFLLVVPGVYFLVRAIYADVVAVTENVHGPTAIQRSFELTKGRFGETFLIALKIWGVYLLAFVAYSVLIIPTVIYLEEFRWFWLLDAAISQLFAAAVIYAHVLLYCWYRKLDRPIAVKRYDESTNTFDEE